MTEETVYSLFDSARNAAKEGDRARAESLYKRVIEEYPDSPEAGVASRELKELTGEEGWHPPTKAESETDYGATVGIAKFVSFVGWVVVFLAIVIFLMVLAAGGRAGLLAFAPVVGSVVGGLLLVMAGQVTRATVENTQNTRRLVQILEENKGQ